MKLTIHNKSPLQSSIYQSLPWIHDTLTGISIKISQKSRYTTRCHVSRWQADSYRRFRSIVRTADSSFWDESDTCRAFDVDFEIVCFVWQINGGEIVYLKWNDNKHNVTISDIINYYLWFLIFKNFWVLLNLKYIKYIWYIESWGPQNSILLINKFIIKYYVIFN